MAVPQSVGSFALKPGQPIPIANVARLKRAIDLVSWVACGRRESRACRRLAGARTSSRRGGQTRRIQRLRFGARDRGTIWGAHGLMALHELSDVFIEVNPRHAAFYHRALCFAVAGVEKKCPRVAAPSMLLRLTVADLTHK